MSGLVLTGAVLFVLFKMWRGWSAGIVRQLVGLIAAVAGVFAGIISSRVVGPLLGQFAPFPERALGVVGGILVGLFVYLVIAVAGVILFKRTRDQSLFPVRLIYGLGGAALGAIYAIILLGATAVGVRVLGSLAETKLALETMPYLAASRPPEQDALSTLLAEAKKRAEESPAGGWLRRIDPMSDAGYERMAKLAKVASSTRAIERLLSGPEMRPVVEHPKVVAVFRESAINRLFVERKYAAVLAHPRVVAAIDDPEVARRLRAVNWDRALDHALRVPTTTAAP